jgi:hypothetical protein
LTLVDRRLIALTGLLAFGCGNEPEVRTNLSAKTPSEGKIMDVRYNPEHTVSEANSEGKYSYWDPTGFQKEGEEKLLFELKSEKPKSSLESISPNIQLVGTPGDMEAVREMSRHLVAAANRKTLPVSKYGFGPFGVSNDLYFGHTFWDMDVWMLPTFLFLDPKTVSAMVKYRLDRKDQAAKNYADWSHEDPGFDFPALKYPWESSVSGKEVCIAKTKLQEHISGDVIWGLTQASAFGLANPPLVEMSSSGVDKYYLARSVKTNRGLEIKDVTSPNEKFTGDNDLYTNLLAEWILNGRNWKAKPSYYLPRDDKSFLNYENDPLRDYQQAAGLLSIYPLQYPPAEKEARVMLERFETGLSSNGPAMGHSVVATIWARLGEPHRAYLAWKQSWVPYLMGPNKLFSERKSVSRTYFYTGAAGAMNTVIYGFGGFRIDRTPLAGAKWTHKMKSGWWLSCKPCVPGEIGKLLFRNIDLDGEHFDFVMSSTGEFSATKSVKKG